MLQAAILRARPNGAPRWALGMGHWLRTCTLATCFNVRDGSPFFDILKGLHFLEDYPSISMTF
ncbi:unnamed protein product, partial [Vitis vinifera]|uniref:Uncharacterized protein n=1 Tax=Vitis vinifera TaxID=29760 RepID=D7TVK3_VITVI